MTYREPLEERMAEWLAAGPDNAPDWPVRTAVAYARAHPRGRSFAGRPGRTIMSQLHLEPVRHPAARIPSALIGLAAAAVLLIGGAFLLAGWLGLGGMAGPPIVTPTPAATSTPTAAPTLAPTLPAVTSPIDVTGTITCSLTGGVSTRVGTVDQYRGVAIPCGMTLTDARVSGLVSTVMDIDQQPDESAEIWGRSTITNTGGAWRGAWRGTVDAGYTFHHVAGVYIGSGGYAGLRFRYQLQGEGSVLAVTGTLERTDAVPPVGAKVVFGESCSSINAGLASEAAGVTTYRGVKLACRGPVSDPRLAGDLVVVADITISSDQSAVLQGTAIITNGAGGWTGSWTGTVDAGYTTHRLTGQFTGTGAYAGLTLPFTQIGTDDELGDVLTGTIDTGS